MNNRFSQIRRNKVARTLAAVATVAGTFYAGARWGDYSARRSDQWGPERLISTAIDSVRANALDALPTTELLNRAVSGMLRELRDPYAALLKPDGAQQYRGVLQGEGQGFGLVIRRQDQRTSITRVSNGSPAAEAGIRIGDRIIEVDGVSIADGWPRKSGSDTAHTAHDDTTHLTLVRPPVGDTLRMTLVRGRWHASAVQETAMIGDHVGYAYLASVSAKASDELDAAVEKLHDRGARSLVLDLRGNGGGLFEEGVRVASLFLERGLVVASLAPGGNTAPQPHRSRGGRWSDMPITLLVDSRTASAAEVIAAGLRDHNRALLVGEPTYGKGLVQRVVKLTPELSLRLTTARWLTPKGVALERRQGVGAEAHGGMLPDVYIAEASRRDPMATPAGITALAASRMLHVADSAAAHPLTEGWASSSVSLLEGRLHSQVDQYLAPDANAGMKRAALVAEATRLATTRVLQVHATEEAVIRYAASNDPAMRAALEIVAPGSQPARVDVGISVLAATQVAKAARDSAAVTTRAADDKR